MGLFIGILSAVLMACACALYIVGAAGKDYWTSNTDQHKVSLGLFGYCISYTYPSDFQNECGDSSCSQSDVQQDNFCDKYNTLRGLLVCAIILSGLAAIIMLIDSICVFSKSGSACALAIGVLAFLCGIVSFAIAAQIYQSNLKSNYSLGYAFDTATAGWIVNLLADCIYLLSF